MVVASFPNKAEIIRLQRKSFTFEDMFKFYSSYSFIPSSLLKPCTLQKYNTVLGYKSFFVFQIDNVSVNNKPKYKWTYKG